MSEDPKEASDVLPRGFIKDFTESITQRVPGINRDYVVACAEAILAGVCFRVSHYNQIGKMNLAVWCLGVTRSGEWKTVPIRDYAIPILKLVEKELPPIGRVVKRIVVPSRFSSEGLIEFMTVHKETIYNEEKDEEEEILVICNEGIMIRDEFTGLMKGVKTKDWMSDISEILSEVYDTSIQPYYTKKSKLQEVSYCNISFLMATTPHIYNIMDETLFTQGLGNRLDYVVFDPPEEPPKFDPRVFFGESWARGKDEMIGRFARMLSGVVNSNLRFLSIDPESEAAEMWTDYRYQIELRKRKLTDRGLGLLKWSYLSRQAEKALRRAGLYCISRNIRSIPRMASGFDTLVVSEEDMRLAIQRQEKYYEYFEKLLSRWMKSPKPRSGPQTDLMDLERMLAIIEDTPYKVIDNPRWMEEAGYGFRNKFYELKKTLLIRGDVVELTEAEVKKLPAEVRTWLNLYSRRTKVYRLSDKYLEERGIRGGIE